MKYQKLWREYWREAVLALLLVANITAYVALGQSAPGPLKVAFLDVGQGDAIYFETPSHKRGLIDGGPGRQVLSILGPLMPFGTRRLDLMMESHPDKDHIGGLPEVVTRYNVGLFMEPGVESDNSIDNELHARLEARGVQTLLARQGQVVDFGDGVKLRILFPKMDVTNWETNEASIVAKLEYGEQSFLLTGDSPIKVENILLYQSGGVSKLLDSDVLKVGHHGSRTSTSLAYAQAVSPEYAVVSAGQGNSYGHPHKEVLEILQKVGAKILSTIESGTIKFETNGESLELK